MDALAGLRQWAYETTFPGVVDEGGRLIVFRIPPLPASEWIIATLQVGHLAYLPGLLPEEERITLMDALDEGTLTMADLVTANQDALEEISGWRWWSASKLVGALAHQFETLGGLLILAGIDMATAPLGAVLAALYARVWEESNKEDRAKWAQEVAMPPQSMLDHENWDEDAATAAVMAFMQAGGTGLPD